jgi:PAS domain S-box-containing protein
VLKKSELVTVSGSTDYGEMYFPSSKLEAQLKEFNEELKKLTEIKELSDYVKAKEFYSLVFESSNDAVIVMDFDGRVYAWNKSAEIMFGYKKEEIIGDIMPMLSQEEIKKLLETIKKVSSGEKVIGYESEWLGRKGKVYVSATFSPVLSEDNKQIGISAFIRDVTDEKKAKWEKEQERKMLDDVISSVNAGLSLVDKEMRIVWFNKTYQKIFGFLEDFKGKKCYEAYWTKNKECANCPCKRAIELGKEQQVLQHRIMPNGERRYLLVTSTPIFDEKGRVEKVAELVIDVSERVLKGEDFGLEKVEV